MMGGRKQQKIGVVGGGLMGHGIAYLFAAAGHDVAVFEPAAEIRASLPRRLRSIVDLLDDDPALLQQHRDARHAGAGHAGRGLRL